MGHQLNQKAFFQNGETIALLSGLGMMIQKKCRKHYVDSSKNIAFSLLSKKNWQTCYNENNI
jgi:hypothetical protein